MLKNRLAACWLLFIFFSNAYAGSTQDISWVDSTLSRMSLNEKIGQLFMVAAYSNRNADYENNLEELIRKYHIGGVIFFQGDPVRQVNLTNRLQKAARYPLLVGMDAEHGTGWRLQSAMEFPRMLINGAVQNDTLIYGLGAAIARHCRELGVHVNFAPVADVNNNPLNPVIGMRSFGEDPSNVTRKALQYIQGSLSEQVLPVAKHFPGHGDTDTDSHQALPRILHSRAHLDSIELYPYEEMIEARIPAIMVAHLNVPALDPTHTPASLSPLIVDEFLKKELGFDGLCFTDALNMKGVTRNSEPGEVEVRALLAGNDVLLFPENPEKAIERIRQAVRENVLAEELITEKCRKILLTKYKFVLPNIQPLKATGLWAKLNTPANFALKQALYREALTLVRNQDALLPLKRLDTLRIASVNFGSTQVNNFQTTLARYTTVHHFCTEKNLTPEAIQNWIKKLEDYNCVILYNHLATNNAERRFGYSSSLFNLVKALQGKRIIFCQPAIPYGLSAYTSLPVDAFLVSYEKHLYAQQYAAQAIFGGCGFHGKLPVGINSQYPCGTGIQTRQTRLGYLAPEMCGISSQQLAQIDTLCQTAIEHGATPGCQVLIAKNGNIIYNKAFGYHTYQKQQANHTSNVYDLASVTKITAALPTIMKLYDDRQIGLDEPLSHYYTPLKNTDKNDITVREVLCHNAGLKSFIPFFANAVDPRSIKGALFTTVRTASNTTKLKDRLYVNPDYRFRDSTLSPFPKAGYQYVAPGIYMFPAYQDSILGSILQTPLLPKKDYAYSDLGFILLKYAAEEITGQPFDRYCKEHFYTRLGMNHTDFLAAERLKQEEIIPSSIDQLYRKTELKGHVHDPAAALLGGIAGHAGLFSTAEDLAKMMQMYLNQGTYGGEYYLAPETIAMFTAKNAHFPLNRRGLGFDKPETDPHKISPVCLQAPLSSFGHTGFTGIMAWCDPDNQLIFIFLSNRTYPDEFNTKLSEENIRTKIQEILYMSLKKN